MTAWQLDWTDYFRHPLDSLSERDGDGGSNLLGEAHQPALHNPRRGLESWGALEKYKDENDRS